MGCLCCLLGHPWVGKAMGVNPHRKSGSRIRQEGHYHRALLVVLAICCDLLSTVQWSASSVRTAVLPRFALDLWRQMESYWGSEQTTVPYLCAWHLVRAPQKQDRHAKTKTLDHQSLLLQVESRHGKEWRVLRISGFGQATANGN